jgi:hypothetical protein
MMSRVKIPNVYLAVYEVTLAVGGAPCLYMQASLFNLKTILNSSFFLATNHYIKNRQKRKKNDSLNVKKDSPNVTKSSPNVIGLVGSKKGKTETANALI